MFFLSSGWLACDFYVEFYVRSRAECRIVCRKPLRTRTCHEVALGNAVWADFGCNMKRKTSPIDLDLFRPDPCNAATSSFELPPH